MAGFISESLTSAEEDKHFYEAILIIDGKYFMFDYINYDMAGTTSLFEYGIDQKIDLVEVEKTEVVVTKWAPV